MFHASRLSRPLTVFVVALGIGGCGVVPWSTQIKLRNFDPLVVDPAEPRALVLLTERLRIVPGSAKIRLVSWRKAQPDQKAEEIFTLQESAEAPPQAVLATAQPGEWPTVLRFRAEDQVRLRKLQAEFAARKRAGDDTYASEIKADIAACSVSGLPEGRITGTLHVKLDPASGYLPMLQSVDLRDLAASAGTSLENEIKPCRQSKAG